MTSTPSNPLDEPLLTIRVYLEDTDAGGIVYHASYLRFMERARTEALRRVGLEQSNTFAQDTSFVVHSMNLRFHAAAGLDAELCVTCKPVRVAGASITFEQQVRGVANGTVFCSAEVVVACISLSSKRPKRVPAALAQRLTGALAGSQPA